jgi:hypothetical protein
MAVKAVKRGIAERSGEPAAILALASIENFRCGLDPVDFLGGGGPKANRIAFPASIYLVITTHVILPLAFKNASCLAGLANML